MDITDWISDVVDWLIGDLFKNIVLFTCPILTYLLVVRTFFTSTVDYAGFYSYPGRTFHAKRLWALFCLHRLRWRKKKDTVGKNYSYGLLPTPEEVKLEEPLPLNGKYGVESTFIFGVDNKRNLLVVRIGTERLEHCLNPEVWIHACIGSEVFQLPTHPDSSLPNSGPMSHPPPPSMGKSCTQVGGLKFEMCEPMRRWRIHFNGMLRRGSHKEMQPIDHEDLVHVRFNFIWTACSSPFYVHRDFNLSLASDALAREPWRSGDWINAMRNEEKGFDQWGTLYGEWTVGDVNGSPSIVHLRGVRRRRWRHSDNGNAFGIGLHHRAEFLGVSHQGGFFSVGVSSMENGGLTHAPFGHYKDPAGNEIAVSSTDISLAHLAHYGENPENTVIRFSANDMSFAVCIRLLPFGDAVMYTGRPWKYKTWLALIDFGMNLDGGVGICEFVFKYDGPCPISTVNPMHRKYTALLGERLTSEERMQLDEMKPLFLPFNDPLCQSSKIVGGKGASLSVLSCARGPKIKIPVGFCLTIFAFQEQVNSNEILKKAISDVKRACLEGKKDEELQDICTRTVDVIAKTPVCLSVSQAVEKGLQCLRQNSGEARFGYAVRSSGIAEDSLDLSAAGQNATVLGCKDQDGIMDALRTCWGSLYAYPSIQYRRQNGLIVKGSEMGVVIQQMVPAEVAGVMFTNHPLTGNPSQVIITANYGLGESVVAAMAEPDTIILQRSWEDALCFLEGKIGEKSVQVSIDEISGGTKEHPVYDHLSNKLCLTPGQALNLGKAGVQIESMFGSPRDIEWAIVKEKIYILQARPITGTDNWTDFELLHELDSPVASDTEVTTLANTGEVLPGAMTPLTSSVMAKALDEIIQQSPDRCKSSIPHFLRNGVITHHQLAMNVINTFFRVNEPTITLSNKVVHLAVFGSPCIHPELHRLGVERHGLKKCFYRFLIASRLILRSFGAEFVTKKAVAKSKVFDLHPTKFSTAKELHTEISSKQYILFEAALDHNYASTAGVFSQIILINVLSEGQSDLNADHYADISLLLSSCANVVSAEIPQDLQELACKISKSDGADEFCSASASEAVAWFDNQPGEASVFFKEFIHKHGHRCLREFDLQSQTWGMKPDCLMNMLQTMVRAAGVGQEKPQNTVEGVNSTIAKLKTPLKGITKFFIRRLLPWCRRSVGRREETKSALVRTLHAFRVAYRHLGHLAKLEGVIPDEDLIFYFTFYEISLLFNSKNISKTAMIRKAVRRRKLRSKWDKILLPETFSGIVRVEDLESSSFDGSQQVTGISASLGVVTGRACVLKSLDEANLIRPDDVLITRSTDVGWAPYFPFLAGIVTEMGGLISHGAVVAREYGLPCIVGASNATAVFSTGDTVKLDASVGILSKIDD